MPELVIAGHLKVDAGRRDEFVAAHSDLVGRARAYPGCIDLSIGADPFDDARVNLLEVWESENILKEWRKVSNPPNTGIDIHDGAVRKHLVSRSGSPFESLEG